MATALGNQMFTPLWQVLDSDSTPLVGGAWFFFDSNNHNLPLNIYQDSGLTIPWPNPIILNEYAMQQGGQGQGGPGIYGTGVYYIELHRTEDITSELIFSQDGYIAPGGSGPPPVVPTRDIQNFIINPQFTLHGQDYNTPSVSVPTSILNVAPGGWVFVKNDTSAADRIQFLPFAPGQTNVPANPNFYINYQCTAVSSTENLKYIGYRFYNFSDGFGNMIGSGVNTLAGQNITLQFEGLSPTSSSVELSVYQYFGANGSAPVLTPISTFVLTNEWSSSASGSPANIGFIIPSIAGKTIDPAGGDYLELRWNVPLNNSCSVALTNVAVQDIQQLVAFQSVPINRLQSVVSGYQIPAVTTQSEAYKDGSYCVTLEKGTSTFSLRPLAGIMVSVYTNIAPSYALLTNGLCYFSNQYYNLANFLWDSNQQKLASGTGIQGFTATVATNTVTCTCYSDGLVVPISNGTSTFTCIQTVPGSTTTQAVATIQTTDFLSSMPGQYFLINSPAISTTPAVSYYVWISYRNMTLDPGLLPALTGKQGVKVICQGDETDAQIASLIALQLNVAQFRVPDTRGAFLRSRSAGATAVLPKFSQITITSTGDDSTVSFAITGLDINGATITEVLVGPHAPTPPETTNFVTSVNWYSAITSIVPTINTPVAFTVEVLADVAGNICQLQTGTATVALLINGYLCRDPDYAARTIVFDNGPLGDNVGSYQRSQNLSHIHQVQAGRQDGPGGTNVNYSNDNPISSSFPTEAEGGSQSNPNNEYVNAIIYF